jgi:cytidylate kinase
VKIAVVGSCGSGKSTIVHELRRRGYEAYVVGQEHSAVANLWKQKNPDELVFLEVNLAALRQRRSPEWPEWLFHQQQSRLTSAREAASVRIDTSQISVEETIDEIIAALDAREAP